MMSHLKKKYIVSHFRLLLDKSTKCIFIGLELIKTLYKIGLRLYCWLKKLIILCYIIFKTRINVVLKSESQVLVKLDFKQK